MEDMAATVALTIRDGLNATLGLTINKASDGILDLKANLQHLSKKFTASDASTTTRLDEMLINTSTRFNEFASRYDARIAESDQRTGGPFADPVAMDDNAGTVTGVIGIGTAGKNQPPVSSPPPRDARTVTGVVGIGIAGNNQPPVPSPPPWTAPASLRSPRVASATPRQTSDPIGILGLAIGYGPHSESLPTTARGPRNSDNTYTLPTGHFGSGLGGPSTPICSEFRPAYYDEQAKNARAAHLAGPAGHQQCLAMGTPSNPYTKSSQTPVGPPQITPPMNNTAYDNESRERPTSPCLDGPILSPRAHQDCTKGINRFDIESLAHPHYHGREDGVKTLIAGFLKWCGYNMLSSDNIVGSFNEIIAAHCRLVETWFNPTANTYGPQIDRILLKSFKLFPQLDSLDTADVVNFYDRFQELSNPHLMALMPFDSIVLKNCYEGLFTPGLGTRRYAACGKALMDFLPRLIPGNLSSRINATLAATWCKTNNGYDYLWRVLELTVPGFDPVVAIHTPQWTDSDDIFHFAQMYLLYFWLQGKMHYHYTDQTRSGIFLRAIQHLDNADTVTTLQSHMNLY
jgi:hypothetical protein